MFPSTLNDTFTDSEIFCYVAQSTPLLQLPDHASTREIFHLISFGHISGNNSFALASNVLKLVSALPFIVVLNCALQLHAFYVRSRRL